MISSAVDRFAGAVDALSLGVDDGELAAVFAVSDRADARVAAAVRAVDDTELWDTRGATSMMAWVAEHARMARGRAARVVKTARTVGHLPVTDRAWHEGRLSTGQVETICSFVPERLVGRFADCEGDLVPVLEPLTVAEVATAMKTWRSAVDDGEGDPDSPGELHASRTLAGRVRVDGNLDGEPGELLLTALRVALHAAAWPEVLPGVPGRSPAERRAEALGDICRFFLDHQDAVPDGGRHRPHVNVVVHLEPNTADHDTTDGADEAHTETDHDAGEGLDDDTDSTAVDDDTADDDTAHSADGPDNDTAENGRTKNGSGENGRAGVGVGAGFRIAEAHTVDGHRLDRITAGTLLCDSLLYRVLVSGKSAIIDYGRATRAVPPPLWNALLLRDQHCRFKGCDRPGHWDHAHHVVPWENGGETNLANLVCLCARHHHIVHRPGWHTTLDPDGTFHVTDPWGITRTTRPPGIGPPTPLPYAA